MTTESYPLDRAHWLNTLCRSGVPLADAEDAVQEATLGVLEGRVSAADVLPYSRRWAHAERMRRSRAGVTSQVTALEVHDTGYVDVQMRVRVQRAVEHAARTLHCPPERLWRLAGSRGVTWRARAVMDQTRAANVLRTFLGPGGPYHSPRFAFIAQVSPGKPLGERHAGTPGQRDWAWQPPAPDAGAAGVLSRESEPSMAPKCAPVQAE